MQGPHLGEKASPVFRAVTVVGAWCNLDLNHCAAWLQPQKDPKVTGHENLKNYSSCLDYLKIMISLNLQDLGL